MAHENLPAVIEPVYSMTRNIAVISRDTLMMLPVLNVAEMAARRKELLEVVKNVLVKDEHYGTTPGTHKASLFKAGAELLNHYFGYYAEFDLTLRVEEWDRTPILFDYEYKCVIRSKRDEVKIGEGVGSCNSYESKYRYREAQRSCPACGRQTIIKGKQEYGGGWVCWSKGEHCKAKFMDKAPEIVDQAHGKVDNPDIASLKNTILKMAAKRSYVDATLKATGASEIFTQDTEDLPFIVEALSVEEVSEAVQDQKKQRANSDPKQSNTTSTAGSAEAAQSQIVTTTTTAKDAVSEPPKPVNTAGQSSAAEAAKEKVAPESASTASQEPEQKVGQEQMKELLAAGKANGWSQKQISDFVCDIFKLTPATVKDMKWKAWKTALGVVSQAGNAKGLVRVSSEGKELAETHHWPKKEG